MEGEAVEGGLDGVGSMADEGCLGGHLEGSDAARGAWDEEREVRVGYRLPGAGGAGAEADDVSERDELQAFAGPDEDSFQEEQKRTGYADVADAFESQDDPVLELEEEGFFGESDEQAADGCFKGTGSDQKDDKGHEGEGKEGVRGEAEVTRGVGTEEDDEKADQDEDVEELLEDDGGEDDGRCGLEVGRVGEATHDVADAEGQDIVGGERGHEDAGAGEAGCAGGAHHAVPAEDAHRVADDAEADEAEDPDGGDDVEGAKLVGGDAEVFSGFGVEPRPEGVPKEEGTDE